MLASGSWTDPDPNSWTATVDYGDGSGPQPQFQALQELHAQPRLYPNSGTYVATVRVTDSENVSGTARLNVTVANVAPAASIGKTPLVIPKKGGVTIQGRGFDPGPGDALQMSWSIARRKGKKPPRAPVVVATGSGPSIHFSTRTKGTYLVTLIVTDSHGAQGVATRTIRR